MAKGNPAATARAIMNAGVRSSGQTTPTSAVSPLVASLGQWGQNTGRGGQAVMPRPPAVFETGAFGPGVPLWPMAIDVADPETDTIEPRRTQYPVYWNFPVGVPGTEGLGKLAPFGVLRTLADEYNIARRCIEARKKEVLGLAWDIVPTPEAAEAMKGSITAKTDWQKRKSMVMGYLERPDRSADSPYDNWAEWMEVILEDRYVTDAVSLYAHPPLGGAGTGWMGSNLGSIDYIDGTTIRPLYDIRGGTPPPSTPAYQQFLWGVPRTDYASMAAGKDTDELGDYVDQFKFRELKYWTNVKRGWAPYGFSPVEQSLLPIQIGLARQRGQLQWYTEGSVPYLYVVPGNDLIQSPQQVRQLQNALNGIAGDQAWKQKIVVLPPGSTMEPIKENALSDQFDEFVIGLCTMQWGMSPQDLGIAPKLSGALSPAAGKAVANANNQNSQDHWLEPEVNAIAALHNFYIQKVMKQTDMIFSFTGLDAPQDESQVTTDALAKVAGKAVSIDEARIEMGLEPYDADWSQVPVIFTPTGAITVPQAIEQSVWEFEQAQKQPQLLAEAGWVPIPPGGGSGGSPIGPRPQDPTPSTPAEGNTDERGNATTPMHEAAENVQNSKPTPPGSAKAQLAELEAMRRVLKKGRSFEDFEPRVMSPDAYQTVRINLAHGIDQAIDFGREITIREHQRYVADLALALTKGVVTQTFFDLERGRLVAEGVLFKNATATAVQPLTVFDYLAQNYPTKDLGWVKDCSWELRKVALDQIAMGRRPGGRDFDKVDAIAERFANGEKMAPVVLVDGDGEKMTVADGYHRTLGADRASVDSLDAYVGAPNDSIGDWRAMVLQMHADKLNKIDDTPDKEADTERLMNYWASEEGRAKINWGVDGDFDRCRAELGKYVQNPHELAGLCANLHHRATGAWPGHAPGETRAKIVLPPLPLPDGLRPGDTIEVVWEETPSVAALAKSYGMTPSEVLDLPMSVFEIMREELNKVGPKGYIHGWIFVGVPGEGDAVRHPDFGTGKVSRVRELGNGHASVSVRWDSGGYTSHDAIHHEGEHTGRSPEGGAFKPREPEAPHVPEPPAPPETDVEPHVTTRTDDEIKEDARLTARASNATSSELRAQADEAHNDYLRANVVGGERQHEHLAREAGLRQAAAEKDAIDAAAQDVNTPAGRAALEEKTFNEAMSNGKTSEEHETDLYDSRLKQRALRTAMSEAQRRIPDPALLGQDQSYKDVATELRRQEAIERGTRRAAETKSKQEGQALLAATPETQLPTIGWKALTKDETFNHLLRQSLSHDVKPSKAKEAAAEFTKTHDVHLFHDGSMVSFKGTTRARGKEAIRKDALDTIAELRSLYPERTPHVISVGASVNGKFGARVLGNAFPGRQFIGVSSKTFDASTQQQHDKSIAAGWWMPSNAGNSVMRTVLTHEFGHTLDDSSKTMNYSTGLRDALNEAMRGNHEHLHEEGISRYGREGRSPRDETYAEAFAEWHSSNGATTNQSVQRIAREAGWKTK